MTEDYRFPQEGEAWSTNLTVDKSLLFPPPKIEQILNLYSDI